MKIDFNRYKKSNNPKKAIIAIHGWGGNKDSFLPFVKNLNINNVEWFLLEAPYLIEEAPAIERSSIDIDETKKSWTYKKPYSPRHCIFEKLYPAL